MIYQRSRMTDSNVGRCYVAVVVNGDGSDGTITAKYSVYINGTLTEVTVDVTSLDSKTYTTGETIIIIQAILEGVVQWIDIGAILSGIFDTPIAVGAVNNAGTSKKLVRADHVHRGEWLTYDEDA